MVLRRTIELAHAQIEVEERSGYLYVVETGQLRNLRELNAYTAAMDEIVAKGGVDKAIIDARGEVGDPPAEVRNAMWDWLSAPDRGFTLVAFILPSEMAVARVNMTALSKRAPVRAFQSVQEAQRWLTRGPRASSVMGMAPAEASGERISSRPPPKERGGAALAPTERPPTSNAPAAVPPAPRVPAEAAPAGKRPSQPELPPATKHPSERGLRRPEPGPSERTARTEVQAPADRGVRDSEVRSRRPTRDTEDGQRDPSSSRPPKGGGSRVAGRDGSS